MHGTGMLASAAPRMFPNSTPASEKANSAIVAHNFLHKDAYRMPMAPC
jgi:hypothetical protein